MQGAYNALPVHSLFRGSIPVHCGGFRMKLLPTKVIAVGGGKGGVGKSFISSNIACGLALIDRKIILIDGDLAGANIHILFGIKFPERTLGDFLNKKVSAFADVLLSTPLPNLRLICNASDLIEIANPQYAQKKKLIGELTKLDADAIVIDIGAGASLNNLDFFNAADTGLIIATPSPTSLQNAYSFFKMAVHRKILSHFSSEQSIKRELTAAFNNTDTFKSMNQVIDMLERLDRDAADRLNTLLGEGCYKLIVNMATAQEGDKVARALAGVARSYLNINLTYLGSIGFDTAVENSIRRMEPLLLAKETALSDTIMRMARRLIDTPMPDLHIDPGFSENSGSSDPSRKLTSSSRVQLCLHDEVLSRDTKLHVQTEDLGIDKAQIVSLVFSGGQLLYSRRMDYREILNGNDVQHNVAERVKNLHRSMLADINNGILDNGLAQNKGD